MTLDLPSARLRAEAWLKGHVLDLLDEVDRLLVRQSELLATIVRVTNETPFSDEAKDALAQRGAMVAEIGTLKAHSVELTRELREEVANREQWAAKCDRLAAQVAEVTRERDMWRGQHNFVTAREKQIVENLEVADDSWHDAEKRRIKAEHQRDSARAEADRMRPVYEAAVAWRQHPTLASRWLDGIDERLIDAIDAALTPKDPTP